MIGAYGPWVASLPGNGPGSHSLRSGRWSDLEAWRNAARAEVWARMNPPDGDSDRAEFANGGTADTGPRDTGTLDARTEASRTVEGLRVEELSWPHPSGARTRATYLRPAEAERPLPGVLALHDHGGKKYFGRRKVAHSGGEAHSLVAKHRAELYGGRAWANELARRGYAVLAPDAFSFASRRVRPRDVPATIRGPFEAMEAPDPEGREDPEQIRAYDSWAADHESIMARSLLCGGTTWPGMTLREDRIALEVLAGRTEVDADRLGCAGLSGGGLRTVFLAGLDDRIRCSVCAGMMTTWEDFLLRTSHTHTWMIYVPLLPGRLDYPEILGLAAPRPALVLHNESDPLFTASSQRAAGRILAEVYEIAGRPEALEIRAYPGGHKFDRPMQEAAFDWLDRRL